MKDGAESTVIDRWYNGSESYDLSRLDTGPADPSLSSINGRIDEAYVTTNKDGPEVSAFSVQDVTDWVYLTLKYSYNVSKGPHQVHLEIVEIYEDGFEFSRRSGNLSAEAKYIGGTAWFSIGPQSPRKWVPGRYWVCVRGRTKGGRGAIRGQTLTIGRRHHSPGYPLGSLQTD